LSQKASRCEEKPLVVEAREPQEPSKKTRG